jgi:hypothetical protein
MYIFLFSKILAEETTEMRDEAIFAFRRRKLSQDGKEIIKTFPTICGRFVLGCPRFAARIYCDEQYFYWAARLAFGNKRGN